MSGDAGLRVAVLASGSGTNLQAIIDQADGRDGISVVAVASDRPGAKALERARSRGIATAEFPRDAFDSREERDLAIASWLDAAGAELIVLAGYMQMLSPAFVRHFAGRMINIHPALLPAFPGLDAIGQALAHGVAITGVTVHFVDEGMDTGPIIDQVAVPIPADRDRGRLEADIHATEHRLLPDVVRRIARGEIGLASRQASVRH